MSRMFRVLLIVALLAAVLPTLPVAAGSPRLPVSDPLPPPLDQCPSGVHPASGALYFVCVPPQWNGDLVIFAHGYVAPQEPLTKFVEQLILADGTTIPELVLSQGYAFATTSYRKNGLAVKEGLADLIDLVDVFKAVAGQAPQHVYLIGASEGGLITTLAAEKYPQTFSGGLALCGPIGDFRAQLNYWGDFRVLYDYFFPAARYPAIQILDSPVWISEAVMLNWDTISQGIAVAVTTDTSATRQLLKTSRAAIDPADSMSIVSTTLGILSYNVFATNEGRQELGGQPFDNKLKWYTGSDNDWKLNGPNGVQRFKAQLPLTAVADIRANYQTSGKLKMPLITMHTTGDPIVPYWHETLYNAKTLLGGTPLKHLNIPIVRYGHCSFKSSEALAAFAILVYKVTGQAPADVNAVLPTPKLRQDYADLVRQYQPELPVDPR